MQKQLTFAVLVIIYNFVVVDGFYANRCNNVPGKYPFDEQKFSGDWFAVSNAIRPKKIPGEVKCDKLHYTAEMVGNVTRIHVDVILKMAGGEEVSIEARGQGIKAGMASATTMSVKCSKDDKWHGVIRHSILATDYETYAIVHGCKEKYDDKTDTFTKSVIDQVWSRSKTLDEATLKTLKSVMSSLDIAPEDWEDIDNSAC